MPRSAKSFSGYSFLPTACWFISKPTGPSCKDWEKRMARLVRFSSGEWVADFHLHRSENRDRYFIERAERDEEFSGRPGRSFHRGQREQSSN